MDDIKNDKELEEACEKLDEIFSISRDDPRWLERCELVEKISAYEDEHIHISPPISKDAFQFRMDQYGYYNKYPEKCPFINIAVDDFVEHFAYESNLIDPQPGHENRPGDPHFDDHIKAIDLAIDLASEHKIADHNLIHKTLMKNLQGMKKYAGKYRTCGVMVGNRICPDWHIIKNLIKRWENNVNFCISNMKDASYEEKEKAAWDLHVEYEKIHPYIDGNGRSGRILMLNHRLLLGVEPIIIEYKNRWEYYKRFH